MQGGSGLAFVKRTMPRTAVADEALGNRLLPVLARQEEQLDAAVGTLFGELGELNFSLTDMAGWVAGTAAADMAELAVTRNSPS